MGDQFETTDEEYKTKAYVTDLRVGQCVRINDIYIVARKGTAKLFIEFPEGSELERLKVHEVKALGLRPPADETR